MQEVKSGSCTSAELIKSAVDCQAAAKALGLVGTVRSGSYGGPPGCIWYTYQGYGFLGFNTNKASTVACGNGTQGTVPPFAGALCLCVNRPCCHAKANYSKYEKNCNTIKDATACYLIQFDPSVYTCDWSCNSTTVVDIHNVSQK